MMSIIPNKLYPMQDQKIHEICIPLAVLKANYDRRGYFARHRHHYQGFRGQRGAGRLAWEALEAELAKYCLPPKYSSYVSFLKNRSEWVRGRYGNPHNEG